MEADGAAYERERRQHKWSWRERSPARASKRGGAGVTGVPAEVPRLLPVVRTHRCRDDKMRRLPVRPEPPPSPGGWREDSLLLLFSSGRTSLSHAHHAPQLRVRIFGRTRADNGALPNDSSLMLMLSWEQGAASPPLTRTRQPSATCKGADKALK